MNYDNVSRTRTGTWNTRGLVKGQRVNFTGGRDYARINRRAAANVEVLELEAAMHGGEYTVLIRHPEGHYGIWVRHTDIVVIADSPVLVAIDAEISALQAKIDTLNAARALLISN